MPLLSAGDEEAIRAPGSVLEPIDESRTVGFGVEVLCNIRRQRTVIAEYQPPRDQYVDDGLCDASSLVNLVRRWDVPDVVIFAALQVAARGLWYSTQLPFLEASGQPVGPFVRQLFAFEARHGLGYGRLWAATESDVFPNWGEEDDRRAELFMASYEVDAMVRPILQDMFNDS
jgi:hypothetical protein